MLPNGICYGQTIDSLTDWEVRWLAPHRTHEDIMINYQQQVPFQRLLVRFVSSSTPIERHLLADKQLTNTERDLIYNTVLILQAALEVWQRKHSKSPRKTRRHDYEWS